MNDGAVRRLMRTAASAALVLGMASGLAGLGALAASPAIAQPSGTSADPGDGSTEPGNGSAPGSGSPTDGITGIVAGLTGGGGKTP